MTTMASQITSLTVVYSTVYSDADQSKHQSSASLAFVWGIHRDRWIPRTKGQLRGKCFHLMTSSCYKRRSAVIMPWISKFISKFLRDTIIHPYTCTNSDDDLIIPSAKVEPVWKITFQLMPLSNHVLIVALFHPIWVATKESAPVSKLRFLTSNRGFGGLFCMWWFSPAL